MLSKVLSKETCADCRFCCAFRRCSLWETPLFPMETVEKLKEYTFVKKENRGYQYGQMDLSGAYKTEDEQEEAPCYFLDNQKGCSLSEEDKPFDCKIWPLRIMDDNGQLVIALTPTCPAINKVSIEKMSEIVENGLGEIIYEYAVKYPFIIKSYKDGFPILKKF